MYMIDLSKEICKPFFKLHGFRCMAYWSSQILYSAAWTACIHFRDSDPIDVLHLNFNILCLLLLYVATFMQSFISPVD